MHLSPTSKLGYLSFKARVLTVDISQAKRLNLTIELCIMSEI